MLRGGRGEPAVGAVAAAVAAVAVAADQHQPLDLSTLEAALDVANDLAHGGSTAAHGAREATLPMGKGAVMFWVTQVWAQQLAPGLRTSR